MFIDSSLELANAETVDATADSSLRVVGGIDLRGGGGKDGGGAITDNATIDLSAGEPIYVVIEVTTEITGTATSNFQLNTHTAEQSKGAVIAGTTLFKTGLSGDNQTVGKRWIFTLPEGGYARYLHVGHNGDGTAAAGAISCFITKDVSNWTSTDTRTE